MLIPKITSYDTKIIPSMYEDWWRITAIYEDKIFWEKEQKKQRKTTAIVSSEILSFQTSMRTVCWVSRFKETPERELSMLKNCYDLSNTIWIDEFMYRLKIILEDDFRSKHANKLTYLYRELSAFIKPIVKVKEKESVMDIVL